MQHYAVMNETPCMHNEIFYNYMLSSIGEQCLFSFNAFTKDFDMQMLHSVKRLELLCMCTVTIFYY